MVPNLENDDYKRFNKLHFILDSSQRALVKCKELFYTQLKEYQATEIDYCKKTGLPRQMEGEKFQQVCNMLEAAPDFYWVEALAQFIFDDCRIPTDGELERRYQKIKTLGHLWLPSRIRSYGPGESEFSS